MNGAIPPTSKNTYKRASKHPSKPSTTQNLIGNKTPLGFPEQIKTTKHHLKYHSNLLNSKQSDARSPAMPQDPTTSPLSSEFEKLSADNPATETHSFSYSKDTVIIYRIQSTASKSMPHTYMQTDMKISLPHI